jgi:Zn-dependent oligopeptidase
MARLKAQKHRVDGAALSEYLSLEDCLRGLALLCQQLFGIALQEV